MTTSSSCRWAVTSPMGICKAAMVIAVLLVLIPISYAKTCAELGHYSGCVLLTNTICANNNAYECKAISLLQWCYAKTASCSGSQYCYDDPSPTIGAKCYNCNSPCGSGQKTCDGSFAYKTCIADTGDKKNCYKWGSSTSCSSNQYCSGGSCVSCSNDCSQGQKRCSGDGYQTCTQDSNNRCWKWGSTQSCGTGKTCSGSGNCVSQCSNQCSSGEKRCNGNGVQTCTTDSNGCRIWGSTTNCGSDEKCSSGSCVKKCLPTNCKWESAATLDEGATATLKADFIGCSGKNVAVSVYDSDWIAGDPDLAFSLSWTVNSDGTQTKGWTTQWMDDTDGADIAPEYFFRIDTVDGSCSTGQELWNTLSLKKVCSNLCTDGQKTCDGNSAKTCRTDKYGCTYWENTTTCASDQKCQDGNCVAKSCQELGHYDWCVLLSNTECHNNNPYECQAIKWNQFCLVKTGTCGSDEICRDPISPLGGARCEKKCVNECDEQWDTRCPTSGAGYEVCKADANGCLKWEKASCTDTQKCQGGTCVAKTCADMNYRDWCVLLGNTKCYENNPHKCKAITETTWCYDKLDTCDANETCTDPLGPQEGAHCELPDQCDILSASWSAAKAEDGDKVMMDVTTTSGCDGKEANFSIYEDDLWPLEDDYTDYRTAAVSGGKASVEWTAAWGPDCAIGECGGTGFWAEAGDPEYYFTATIGQNNKSSDNLDVEPRTLGTENLSAMLAANAPINTACLNSTTLSQGCIERINDLGGNFTRSGEDVGEWDAVTAVWKTSCGGCAIGLAGVGLGLLACSTGVGCSVGAPLGMYSSPLMLGGCGLCVGVGDLEIAIGSAKIGAALAMRSAGVAKTLAQEEAILKANKAEIISVESSSTGGRIVAKIDGTIKEWWVVVTNTGNKIRKYYRTVMAGDIDAEADDLAIKYMLDRSKVTFPSGSKNALKTIFRLEKMEGLKIGAESDEVMAVALRYFRQEDQDKFPSMLRSAGLDPKNVRITFRTLITDDRGKEIAGRTITSGNGITNIEISTGYLWDDFMNGALTEEKMASIVKHATLSHEAAHYPVDKALDAGIIGTYPNKYGEGFAEYVVNVMKYRIDPDAMAATRLEIDEGLWLVRKDRAMADLYDYSFLRADAIKAGKSDIVEVWDDELAAKAQAKGMKPSDVLAEVYAFTQRIILDGDRVVELAISQPKSQEIGSILSSLFAESFALVNIWDIINGNIPPDDDEECICATTYDPVCAADGKTYDNECEAECAGTTVVHTDACSTCSNDCTSGQKRCSGDGYQTCTQDSSNRCWKWGSTQSCGTGKTCSGSGNCVSQCSNQCSSGEKRCNGNGYQTCTIDSNGCRIWGTATNCASNEKCSSGSCVPDVVCAQVYCTEGEKSCNGNSITTCQTNRNGCKNWITTVACNSNERCESGACVKTCQDACLAGEKKCASNGPAVCEMKSNGCYGWTVTIGCGANEKCKDNACMKKCTMWKGKPVCPSGERCEDNICVAAH